MYGTYQRLRVRVSASSAEVVRAAQKKLAPKAFKREHRAARRKFYLQMLGYHAKEQAMVREWRL